MKHFREKQPNNLIRKGAAYGGLGCANNRRDRMEEKRARKSMEEVMLGTRTGISALAARCLMLMELMNNRLGSRHNPVTNDTSRGGEYERSPEKQTIQAPGVRYMSECSHCRDTWQRRKECNEPTERASEKGIILGTRTRYTYRHARRHN